MRSQHTAVGGVIAMNNIIATYLFYSLNVYLRGCFLGQIKGLKVGSYTLQIAKLLKVHL